jgi:hypothetical protein
MNGAPYRSIGGAVIADHGPIPLAHARRLAAFYASEALHWRGRDALTAGDACARRAAVLRQAVRAAETWRRAAGWTDPDAADGPLIRASGGRREPHATRRPRHREDR